MAVARSKYSEGVNSEVNTRTEYQCPFPPLATVHCTADDCDKAAVLVTAINVLRAVVISKYVLPADF